VEVSGTATNYDRGSRTVIKDSTGLGFLFSSREKSRPKVLHPYNQISRVYSGQVPKSLTTATPFVSLCNRSTCACTRGPFRKFLKRFNSWCCNLSLRKIKKCKEIKYVVFQRHLGKLACCMLYRRCKTTLFFVRQSMFSMLIRRQALAPSTFS